ncbi:mechanosensitive ion channel [Cryomorpha ignava]|uniref:Mechanosensitive ion channel n=1 Tax=Cryomorpha ignava TaxID=101383 RepID=A0A7K3WPM0_9FLAO|nr:mechanosensitive ion channel domain-containing protein [Cryomorpha ignava]NEN23603.1 mechanosensitive ion channel [Cryomorpha ignava]
MSDNETQFAQFIEDWLLDNLGVDPSNTQFLKMVILVVVTVLVAIILRTLGQFFINKFIKRVVQRTSAKWDDVLMDEGVFRKLGYLVPAIYITGALPFVFTDYPGWIPAIKTLTSAYIALVIVRIFISFISATNIYFSRSERFKDKPIGSFTQLAKIIVWITGIIFVLSILIDRNPIALFGAMGAISAVLLLIFKDTILGFIASIQLTINDMVRIGDWVSVPKYGADGDVMEIYLTTIKVKNWDNTISTVPTYSFVSDSFKNWRGMQESGGRRIKRAISFKISSVQFVDDEMLERFSKIELAQPHIEKRSAEIKIYNEEKAVNTEASIVNGRRMTNLGIFRAYILNVLRHNPNINQDLVCMVRQQDPTELGVPLEVYCFSRIKSWIEYEGIQSDIFDHILATANHFDLEVFENPASSDIRNLRIINPKPILNHD